MILTPEQVAEIKRDHKEIQYKNYWPRPLLELCDTVEELRAELDRVTKELDEEKAARIWVQADLSHSMQENAELRADRERLTKLLSDCLGILEIALRAHPGGAFLNAVCEEDLPRFRTAIHAAREELERQIEAEESK